MTMKKNCIEYVRKSYKCQIYGDKINTPTIHLYNMVSPWLFSMWGLDVIGIVNPNTSNGHHFILVVINYFIKQVKAYSYAHITQNIIKKVYKKRSNLLIRFIRDSNKRQCLDFNGGNDCGIIKNIYIDDQAFELVPMQFKNEWCCRSCQQKYQQDYE